MTPLLLAGSRFQAASSAEISSHNLAARSRPADVDGSRRDRRRHGPSTPLPTLRRRRGRFRRCCRLDCAGEVDGSWTPRGSSRMDLLHHPANEPPRQEALEKLVRIHGPQHRKYKIPRWTGASGPPGRPKINDFPSENSKRSEKFLKLFSVKLWPS